jgi:hypothetical protein
MENLTMKYELTGYYNQRTGGEYIAEVEASSPEEARRKLKMGLGEIRFNQKWDDNYSFDINEAEITEG